MRKSKSESNANLYRVTGKDGEIYLRRMNRYLKQNEELELEPQEAEVLLAAGLVEKVNVAAPQDFEEETQE